MDVQPAPNVGAIAAAADNVAPAQTAIVGATTGTSSVAPDAASDATNAVQTNTQQQPTLAPAVAKLFGAANAGQAQLSVSYRVEGGDVVTVFTDPHTHKEIAQFPPELLLGLAQFFDQQSGVTFDKSA